jgi:hypothetical protein
MCNAGATTTSPTLCYFSGTTFVKDATPASGTWRNVSGINLDSGRSGMFQRIS